MATVAALVARTRRYLRDYPAPVVSLSVSLSDSATSITVTDATVLAPNYTIEVDQEVLLVGASVSSTVTMVTRGWAGSSAVSHANSSSVLVRPGFFSVEILDALNAAKDEMYPLVYKPVLDTSLTADSDTYEFTVPSTIRHLSSVELLRTGESKYRPMAGWRVRRAATPKLVFKWAPAAGTLRLHGFGPFDDLTVGGSSDTLFPSYAENAMVLGAASRLLGSGEAGRARFDVGVRDDREAANRSGSSISVANHVERRFEKALARAAMPPLPTNIVSVL